MNTDRTFSLDQIPNLEESKYATFEGLMNESPKKVLRRLHSNANSDENERLMSEFSKGGKYPVYTIPYEYVGANLTPFILNDDISFNFPDWYMLTPAYAISNAGMTTKEHIVTFFNPNSSNNAIARFQRWTTESKSVIYTDAKEKTSSFIAISLLLMTCMISVWQTLIEAEITYQFIDPNSHHAPTHIRGLETLNNLENHKAWIMLKALLSGMSGIILLSNIYKRTTLPKKNVQIKRFTRSGVEYITPAKALRQPTQRNLFEWSKSQRKLTAKSIADPKDRRCAKVAPDLD